MPDFDIAMSFAGPQREYVELVAVGLRARGFRVFFDQFERSDLLGRDLIIYLEEVYSTGCSAVAAFISQDYIERPWPSHERASAMSHALLSAAQRVPHLLPLRFDDTRVPGMPASISYDDLRVVQQGELRWRRDLTLRHPRYVASFLGEVLLRRGIGPSPEDYARLDSEDGVEIQLLWLSDGDVRGVSMFVPSDEAAEGWVELGSDQVSPGIPTGRYQHVAPDLDWPLDPQGGKQTFLHENLKAYSRTRVLRVRDGGREDYAIEALREAISNSVEKELRNNREAVALGSIVTWTSGSPNGVFIHGVCVLARSR